MQEAANASDTSSSFRQLDTVKPRSLQYFSTFAKPELSTT